MVDGLIVQVLGRDDSLDDLLLDLLSELFGSDLLTVLSRNDNSVYSDWNNGTVVMLVLDGDLSLSIWSEPWQASVSASRRHSSVKLVCQLKGQREQLWGLIGSISEHDTLVTSTHLLEGLLVVQTLCDIWGLFLDSDQDVASLVIETLCRVVISDVLDGVSDDLLVVEAGLGGDLTEDHDHPGLGGSLTSDLGERVFC